MHNPINHIKIIKSIDLDFGVIELRNDNIITFEPKEGITTLTLLMLQESLDIFIELSDGIPRLYFSNNNNLKSLGTEEKIFIKNNIHRFAKACATTENSAITRFITYTFMQLFKPSIPLKMFKTKEEAYVWLRTFNK